MYCTNCGTKFEGNFCPNCGQAASSAGQSLPVTFSDNRIPELVAVDAMEGIEFENFCVSLLGNWGFIDLKTTKSSGDQGVDIIGTKQGVKYAIQCKRYSSPLGNAPIQEVNAGRIFYDCHVAAVMTNSTFTSGAKELAEKTGVLLWDRSVLSTLITFKQPLPPMSPSETESYKEIDLLIDQLLKTKEQTPSNCLSDTQNECANEKAFSQQTDQRYCDAISYLMRRSKVSKLLLQIEFNWLPDDAEEAMALLSCSGMIESTIGIQKPLRDRDYLFLFRQAYIKENLPDGYYEGISKVPAVSKAHSFFLASLRISLRIWDAFCSIFQFIVSIFKKIHNSKYRNVWYVLLCFAVISFFASIS